MTHITPRAYILTAVILLGVPAAHAGDTTYVPFVITVTNQQQNLTAQLNQDGSWTIAGTLDIDQSNIDAGTVCVLDNLKAESGGLLSALSGIFRNATPNNTEPMTEAQMDVAMENSPVIAPCLPLLRPHLYDNARLRR